MQMYLFPLLDVLRYAPVWLLAMDPSASLTVMKMCFVLALFGVCDGIAVASNDASLRSMAWMVVAFCPRFDFVVVDPFPAQTF